MNQREIKFRAWNKKEKQMLNANDLIYNGIFIDAKGKFWQLHQRPDFIGTSAVNDLIPLQFTGLKDKNGKEVFECDVIETKDEDGDVWKIEVNIPDIYKRIFVNPFKVIGNIYENPELLK